MFLRIVPVATALSLVCPALAPAPTATENYTLDWSYMYDSGAADIATNLAVAATGEIYAAGMSDSGIGGGHRELLLLRVDPDGVPAWEFRKWSHIPHYSSLDIALDSQGPIVVGFDGNDGGFVTSVSGTGIESWSRNWGTSSHTPTAAQIVGDRVYVASDFDFGPYMPAIIILDRSSGAIVCDDYYVSSTGQLSNSIAVVAGNSFVGGTNEENNALLVSKYDGNCERVSAEFHGVGGYSPTRGTTVLAPSPISGLSFVGSTTIRGLRDVYVVEQALDLEPRFVSHFDFDDSHDDVYAAVADGNGAIYIAGTTTSTSTRALIGRWEAWWRAPLGGVEAAVDIDLASSGAVLALARRLSDEQTVLAYDAADGQLLGQDDLAAVADPVALVATPDGGFVTVGNTNGAHDIDCDIVVAKYLPSSSVAVGHEVSPPTTARLSVTPSTGEIAVIHYDLPSPTPARLRVFDVRGRAVADIESGPRAAGSYAARWDGNTVRATPAASGVYFIRLDTSVGVETRRFVLVR